MKKFVFALLMQAFIFVVVHDYVIESIDSETQSELYLYASGQLLEPCDVSKIHQVLHDSMMAIDVLPSVLLVSIMIHESSLYMPQFTLSYSPESIYHPPIV